jgi:hypothetical protein
MTAVSHLAAKIHRQLDRGEVCTVYEFGLIRIWPLNEKYRDLQITQFAKQHGFGVRFYRMGWCTIFDRAR